MNARETIWMGCRFRSRHEARWAVFYTHLGVPWIYEPEGFLLFDGTYLPDFWLPEQRAFVEIKWERRPNADEITKARDLCANEGKPVFVFFGEIPYPDPLNGGKRPWIESALAYHLVDGEVTDDTGHWWCRCPTCGAYGIAYQGRHGRLECGHHRGDDRVRSFDEPTIVRAYAAARAARFEFSEREDPPPRAA